MIGNIIGEQFSKFVKDQIKIRQQVYGDGFSGQKRNPAYINYLNSRTSWVKLASSAELTNEVDPVFAAASGKERLEKLGLSPIDDFLGQNLARKAILFNGLESGNFTKDGEGNESLTSFNKRFGVAKTNSLFNNSAYGLGGTDFGLQPMPGITSISIDHINRGSIKKAQVQIKAYNKTQFEILEILYLRLGFTMILEYGNSSFINNDGEKEEIITTLIDNYWFENSKKTHLEVLSEIEKTRELQQGNYDAFFGKVSNFSWSFNPDGSYDITLDLISLGDVIESIKANILDTTVFIATETEDTDATPNYISEFLKTLRSQYEINNLSADADQEKYYSREVRLRDKIKAIKENIEEDEEYIENYFTETVSLITENTAIGGNGVGAINSKKSYFIRFGAFLDFVRSYILPRIVIEDESFPIVRIKNDPTTNIMRADKFIFSTDPGTCVVRNDNLSGLVSEYYQYNDIYDYNKIKTAESATKENIENSFSKFRPWSDIPETGTPIFGRIMDIYLNFNFLENALTNNLDSEGNLQLFNYLKSICNGINKSLGNFSKLEPIIDEESNSIVIIESNNIPGVETLIGEKDLEDSILEVYGYNPNENSSNFVRDFNFQTEITPDLATTITIGATANGSVVGEDATSFSKWNQGLIDRYKKDTFTPSKYVPPVTSTSENKDNKFQKYVDNLELNPKDETYADRQKIKKLRKKEKKRRADIIKAQAFIDLGQYLQIIFGTSITNTPYYFRFDKKYIKRGEAVLKNQIEKLTVEKKEKQNIVTSKIGFIPIRLSLTVDGISGVKIYNKIIINADFLPSNYPKTFKFLITKVGHKLENNNWSTVLETLSMPNEDNIEYKIIDQTGVNPEDLNLTLSPEILEFSPPVGGNGVIRSDSGGDGNFLSPREDGRVHTGIDLKTNVGQDIFSPIDGVVKKTKAKTTSNLLGLKIEGTGDYNGYKIFIFYLKPLVAEGTKVKAGDRIAQAVSLRPDYPAEVTDHIHYKVESNGLPLNPNRLQYTNPLFLKTGESLLDETLSGGIRGLQQELDDINRFSN